MLSLPLLGRSRSWAVPLWLSLLSLLTPSLLCTSPAHAQYPGGGSGGGYPGGGGGYPGGGPPPDPGHYWQVTYASSGTSFMDYFAGNKDNILPFGPVPWTDTLGETAGGGGIGGQYAADAMAIGSITPTLTWVPAAGQTLQTDPSSEPVYILETASAFWSTTYAPLPWTGADVSDGLGDPAVAVDLIYGAGQTSSGTHLVRKDGSSGTIKLDPVWMDADTPTYTSSSIWGYAVVRCSLGVQAFNATLLHSSSEAALLQQSTQS